MKKVLMSNLKKSLQKVVLRRLIRRGKNDYVDYLGEYRSKVKIAKISKSHYCEVVNGEKNQKKKISCYCPFKILLITGLPASCTVVLVTYCVVEVM